MLLDHQRNESIRVARSFNQWLIVGARKSVLLPVLLLFFFTLRVFGVVDTNNNGLSDVWEQVFSLSGASANTDPDADGQNNLQESIAGTDPLDASSVFRLQVTNEPAGLLLRWRSAAGRRYQIETATSPASQSWQVQPTIIEGTGDEVVGVVPRTPAPAVFCRLRVVADAGSPPRLPRVTGYDTDGDGSSDFDEHFAGTDPFSAESKLQILRGALGRSIRLSWPGAVGKAYLVEVTTNAFGTGWKPVTVPLTGVASPMSLSILPRNERQFYRVRVTDTDVDSDGITEWEEFMAGTATGPWHYRTNFPTRVQDIVARLNSPNIINIEPDEPTANVTTLSAGSFRIRRTGNVAPLRINYFYVGDAEPGTDYQPLTGVADLPAGQDEISIPIVPLASSGATPAKSVFLGLVGGVGYTVGTNVSAEVRIVREIALSVKDFGAVGDGLTDDTLAIQAAIDALEASSNHNTLHFPAGVYRLNSPKPANNQVMFWNYLLKLGNTELAGRDLYFTGAPGSRLYSTVHDVRAHMLTAYARFRSLTFRNMHWAKEDTALPEVVGREPNEATGVIVFSHDARRVEAVEFLGCTFDNCHGAMEAFGQGFDLRGRLARFEFRECGVTNRFGPNTTNSWLAYGGGQQVRLGPWVGRAIYADNYFDGGSPDVDPLRNPGGRMKDGSHFGSPLNLTFTNNVVRNMDAEAVHQYDDPYMATTAGYFSIPPPDGTPALASVYPSATTFMPGQLLNFRMWFHLNADPTNVFLHVVTYNPTNRIITVTNSGLTPGVVGQMALPRNSIYLSDYNPTVALIAGNLVENTFQSGLAGITANAKATIHGNTIVGFQHGVFTYENPRNPLHPPTAGMVVDSNLILTKSPLDWPYRAEGILTYGPGEKVVNNLVITPHSKFFRGVVSYDKDSWIEGNTMVATTVVHYGYSAPERSVGVGFGQGTSGGTAAMNRTRGLDVGVGPESANQIVPHRVITHISLDDVLPIDPIGLVP